MERKPRVHELARELGVPAKDVLAWLGKEQVFANSASSRVAVTIAARLRADTAHWGERRAANAKAAGSRFTRAGAKVGAADLDVELPPRVAPLVGLWLKPHPRVRAGVTYRGQLSLDLALDPDVLDALRTRQGGFVRLPGSWRDF